MFSFKVSAKWHARKFSEVQFDWTRSRVDVKLTRKYMWNTKRPQPTPDSKEYWLSRICPCFGKSKFLGILAKFGHYRWPNLAKTVKRHIYSPRPFIWSYSQVSTTIRYKETAWKRIDDGPTDGHPKSIGPQPLGLGPNKNQFRDSLDPVRTNSTDNHALS